MTVFSGLAALMCLLVGLQLFSLETRIGQAAGPGPTGADPQFSRWRTEVHTGAIMSLGAGVLIFLFGLRNHARSRSASGRPTACDLDPSPIEPDSLSIRVFEVDDQDRSVELTAGDDLALEREIEKPPILWHPLDDRDDGPDPDLAGGRDPAESIVQSIEDAVPPGRRRSGNPSASPRVRKSFLGRLFGR